MAKLGRIFEQPLAYVIIVILAVLFYVTGINKDAGIILGFLSLASFALYMIRGKGQVMINRVKGNTFESITIASIGVLIVVAMTFILSIFLSIFPTGTNANISNLATFLEFAKGAVLGASTSPFADNPAITFAIYVIAFAYAETVVIAQFYDYLVGAFGGKLDIKNPVAWAVAVLMGIAAIFYHIGVKVTQTGAVNPNSLMIIFIIFFVECLMVAYTKDIEASVWHHMINNAVSLSAITFAALTNPFVIIIIVLVFLSVTKGLNFRRWFA